MAQKFPKTLVCSLAILGVVHVSGLLYMVDRIRTTDFGASPWMLFAVVAVLYGIIIALLFLVARGANWARLVYTLLGVFGLLASIRHLVDMSEFSLAANAAKAFGILLLFVPATNAWFRHGRS